jgi:hypothetical protein
MIIERMVSHLSALTLVGAAAFLIATYPARADEDVGKEVGTAATHAGMAAGATDMKTVQMHLHHTVNCLVGPAGAGYDAGEANPCKGQGNGAIPDTKDAAKLASLNQALAKANAGLKETDMAAAQQDATASYGLLKQAM